MSYYKDQLAKLGADKYGATINIKLTSNDGKGSTNWMPLNEESIAELRAFLDEHFPKTADLETKKLPQSVGFKVENDDFNPKLRSPHKGFVPYLLSGVRLWVDARFIGQHFNYTWRTVIEDYANREYAKDLDYFRTMVSEVYVYKGYHIFKYKSDKTCGINIDGEAFYCKNITLAVLHIDNLTANVNA